MIEDFKQDKSCMACRSDHVKRVLSIGGVPAHCCVLWETKEAAVNCPKGNIELNFCENCGHLYNQAFDPTLMHYSQEYDNTLDFSTVFQAYARELKDRLVSRYDLDNKDIIEIGCGKGDFLKLICGDGKNRGYGFDKSYDPSLEKEKVAENVTFIQDFYSDQYKDYPADLILCRHVLEHIDQPVDFVSGIKALNNGEKETIFYFEVPNILYTLRDEGIWDLIYEHCSYYNAVSITNLFEDLDFRVLEVGEYYGGQFLSIEAGTQPGNGRYSTYTDLSAVRQLVETFGRFFEDKISSWKEKLQDLKRQNKNVVVWGGGSKGVSFLNFLDTGDHIHHIVDINPRKQGKYVAGTGQEYIMPDQLKADPPDTVILMNPVYKGEIESTLQEMGLRPEILVA